MSRFLGVDYGTKRIGLAISDASGILAFPKEIVANDKNAFKRIDAIIKKEKINEIVVGESINFLGKPNALYSKIEVFISEIKEKLNLPVHKEKEFLTSVEARRTKNGKNDLDKSQAHSKIKKEKTDRVDARAAAIILQRYLDKINKKHD